MQVCIPWDLELTQSKQVTQEQIQEGPKPSRYHPRSLLSWGQLLLVPVSQQAWLSGPVPRLKDSGLCTDSHVPVVQTPHKSLSQGGELQGPLPLLSRPGPQGFRTGVSIPYFRNLCFPGRGSTWTGVHLTVSPGDQVVQQPADPEALSVES